MPPKLRLSDEPGRIAALNRLCVLDTCREDQFDSITSLVGTVLNAPVAAVSLVDVNRQWFKSINGLAITETPRSLSFCDHTIRGGEPMNIADTRLDARFATNDLVTSEPFIRAYLGAPLTMNDGYNVGALCALDHRPRNFTSEQERILTKFARLVVDELELRHMADHDHLTGALTRRAFLERLGQLRREDDQRSVLAIFDLDHFKAVNDRFGHPVGDEVLSAVAQVCKSRLTRGDVFGRVGGEEFGLLLTEVSLVEAFTRIESMRVAIGRLSFAASEELTMTASFVLLELDEHSPSSAMAIADAALYSAKRSGRNQSVNAADLLVAA
ncbi:sensor domain-containing diguanylate cyclase [Sphingomonas glaciei]|uniref:diguanylate cyclase n=1 Tax=Sphingomonas glaciei TaxID=2938948 RepID=A0ABY5MY33_9SPHN|nr:sensor domain-containing diguanylate cyclase [Sphingomonas glaciei]UUR08916.1 sensor domain-containing diguanylate cyclase [Sphingomonas glaciei]